MDAKETLAALLKRNREHERAAGPGTNNHVPMVLIGLYRLSGSPAQMNRYVEGFDLAPAAEPVEDAKTDINAENWKNCLGRGEFSRYVAFFESWTKQASIKAVLEESISVLMKGVSSAAYHALLRLAYALDYASREEVVFSLAYWAASFYPGPELDLNSRAVDPDALFADIVTSSPALKIKPTGSIDGRIRQVYHSKGIANLWKPIRIPNENPLENMSALILETFVQTQHFTLLHALTSCQALTSLLPYLTDPEKSLSHYWHSVCAAYVTVYRSSFEVGKDTVVSGVWEWKELFVRAAASEQDLEHTIKVAYACWLEFQRYKREQYRAVAAREIMKPSPFV